MLTCGMMGNDLHPQQEHSRCVCLAQSVLDQQALQLSWGELEEGQVVLEDVEEDGL